MIELKNISKQYRKGTTILEDINLRIEDGDYIALIGPSGAGKTTLMNIIGCLDYATDGKYFLDGYEILDYSEREKAKLRNEKFGFVVQDFALINEMTVYENVKMPLRYSKKVLKNQKKHIEDILKSLGVESKKEIKVKNLSGGQQQRVAIARAMVNSPEIILADEPTGALDQRTGREVMKIFSKLNKQGKTIIIVTHDPNIAAKCNRIIKIVDGKIQE